MQERKRLLSLKKKKTDSTGSSTFRVSLAQIINFDTDIYAAKQMDKLDKQLAPIRKTFNERIEFVACSCSQ